MILQSISCDEWLNLFAVHFISSHLISSHLISSHLISFHFISSHLISFHFISFHFISSHLISFHFISSHFISFHFISFHFISSHFISSHFISFHVSSSHFHSVISITPFSSFTFIFLFWCVLVICCLHWASWAAVMDIAAVAAINMIIIHEWCIYDTHLLIHIFYGICIYIHIHAWLYTFPYWKEQAHHKAKKRKMREIRGGGKNVMEEEAEEEHDFEEDEEVADEEIEPKSATADAATAGTATGDAATADTATGDAATADAATADAATADAATGDASLDAETAGAATRDTPGEQQVLRRVRGKRKASEAAQAISTPSPVQPRRLFSGSSLASLPSPASSPRESSGRKRQATISRFFSPASGEQEPDEEPLELPKKPAWRIKDTIKALVNMGSITGQGEVIRGNEQLIEQLSSAVQQTMEYKHMKQQRGGRPVKIGKLRGVAGGMKTNMRLKGQKRLRDELPVATKHDMCLQIQEMRVEYASEKDTLKAAARKFKMRVKKLQAIWMKRLEWKSQVAKYKLSSGVHDRPGSSGAMKGSHGPHAAKQQRKRASGGGRKLTFPLLYEKTKNWLHDERAHGHTVLRRHVAWKFQEFLTAYKLDLQMKQDNEQLSHQEKHDLKAAEKMLEAMSSRQGNADKRADHIIKWMGAKVMQPNLVTQLSEVEMQVRAELTWQHHDFLISKIAQMREDDYKELFARPDQAKQQMRTCALCFSDQVPLWVKKPSSKEVFANWEIRTSPKSVQVHRKKHQPELRSESKAKGIGRSWRRWWEKRWSADCRAWGWCRGLAHWDSWSAGSIRQKASHHTQGGKRW